MKLLVAVAAMGVFSAAAHAQMTPVGLWKTIDDETKQPKSLVRISESGGVVTGKIEKLFNPSEPDPKCDKCSDDRKNQPIVGMQIIRNVRQDADDKSIWTGGEILDPGKGKTYKARFKPTDGGAKLEMRGYIGFLYRTQVWERAE